MSILSNPIFICGMIAFGIIAILIAVVVIFCKKSNYDEREELMAIADEIESNAYDNIETSEDKIEDVLNKMQEALDTKGTTVSSFEEEQEENAIISYQELLNSLGAKSSINIDAIETYDDELENQIEISDINKEIIDAYQKESLDREIYMFQNDYSNQPLQVEIPKEDVNFMNFDFSNENVEFVDESVKEDVVRLENNIVAEKKFKKTEIISPVYGVINDKIDEVEEIIFDDGDSLLDEF